MIEVDKKEKQKEVEKKTEKMMWYYECTQCGGYIGLYVPSDEVKCTLCGWKAMKGTIMSEREYKQIIRRKKKGA